MPRVTAPHGAARTDRLRVRPFRALRYAADGPSHLADVTSPPYDVIGEDGVRRYEDASPVNVVRLVLPRRSGGDDRYAHAARDLGAWVGEGVLVAQQPAVYAYEQEVGGVSWRGLLGAFSVHDEGSTAVLPHEDVFPGPVADRAALMEATHAQLEPIMLVHQGSESLGALVRTLTPDPPDLEVTTDDGVVHRLWPLADEEALRALDAAVGSGHALIADGHHRYAAYQAQRRRHAGDAGGAWDLGLGWLVDATTHPLQLTAIHRTLDGITMEEVLAATRPYARSVPLTGDPATWLADLATARETAFVVTDGERACWVHAVDASWLEATLVHRPAAWRRLDAVVLHEALLLVALGVAESDPRLGYAHDPRTACEHARAVGGVAVLMRPPALAEVLAAAAEGVRMPRKSTSFGPKPRNGLVLRQVRHDG